MRAGFCSILSPNHLPNVVAAVTTLCAAFLLETRSGHVKEWLVQLSFALSALPDINMSLDVIEVDGH